MGEKNPLEVVYIVSLHFYLKNRAYMVGINTCANLVTTSHNH